MMPTISKQPTYWLNLLLIVALLSSLLPPPALAFSLENSPAAWPPQTHPDQGSLAVLKDGGASITTGTAGQDGVTPAIAQAQAPSSYTFNFANGPQGWTAVTNYDIYQPGKNTYYTPLGADSAACADNNWGPGYFYSDTGTNPSNENFAKIIIQYSYKMSFDRLTVHSLGANDAWWVDRHWIQVDISDDGQTWSSAGVTQNFGDGCADRMWPSLNPQATQRIENKYVRISYTSGGIHSVSAAIYSLTFQNLCVSPAETQLSAIGQVISNTVRPPAMGNCGSTFEGLIITPSPGDPNGESTAAFEEFANLARAAKYEIAFTSMDWLGAFRSDYDPDDPDTRPEYAGDIFLNGIEDLYDSVISNPTTYPQGMTVRILMGLPYDLAGGVFYEGSPKERVLQKLAERGIPANDTAAGWTIRVADYAQTGIYWSHVKTMIVDGETVIATGYNMTGDYFLGENTWDDMGVKLSGAIAQEALVMFDNLWQGATVCVDYTPQGLCLGTTVANAPPYPHVPEVLSPKPGTGQNVFSLFRSSSVITANNAIVAAMTTSTQTLNLIQAYVAWYFYTSPRYVDAMLQAVENGSNVRYIFNAGGSGPEKIQDQFINYNAYFKIVSRAILKGLNLTKLEARASRGRVHTKALSIDEQMLIVGSLNFDHTSWGGGLPNLAEYDIAIDDTNAVEEYNNYFETMWGDENSRSVPIASSTNPNLSIQNLVNQALPDTTIVLPPGTYQESVVVDKPLEIMGISGANTVIEPPSGQPAFRVTSGDVFLYHLTVQGSTGPGVELVNTSANPIGNILIRKVLFRDNTAGGVSIESLSSGSSISYTLENNTFIGGQYGVRLNLAAQAGVTATVRNNLFSGQSTAPIKIDSASDGGVNYGYNLFDNCIRAVGGVCPTNWYAGTLSSTSNAHDNLLNLDPQFTNPGAGDYTLQPTSPAIDAGDPATVNERGLDGLIPQRADIGAFEAELVLDTPNTHFQEVNGQVTMEAEHFTWSLRRGSRPWLTQTTLAGSTGEGYLSALPDTDVRFDTPYTPTNPELQYTINFTTPGIYTVWLRGYVPNGAGDSLYVALDEQPVMTLTGFAPGAWTWTNQRISDAANGVSGVATFEVIELGFHTLRLWQREDGLRLDRMILTTDSQYNPVGNGPVESDRISN